MLACSRGCSSGGACAGDAACVPALAEGHLFPYLYGACAVGGNSADGD